LPVLAGVKLHVAGDSLTVTGTDLELTIRLTVAVGGERDGAAVVPARLVARIRSAAGPRPFSSPSIESRAVCALPRSASIAAAISRVGGGVSCDMPSNSVRRCTRRLAASREAEYRS
jgi:hypothetical protein